MTQDQKKESLPRDLGFLEKRTKAVAIDYRTTIFVEADTSPEAIKNRIAKFKKVLINAVFKAKPKTDEHLSIDEVVDGLE